jgi:transcription elongation factor
MIDYDRSETSQQGYTDDVAQFTASDVQQFLVLVDLRRGRVVQVDPNGADVQITNAVGNLRRRSTPLGD